MKIEKGDILDYFNEAECSTCEFKEECKRNENEFDSLTLCDLFGVV